MPYRSIRGGRSVARRYRGALLAALAIAAFAIGISPARAQSTSHGCFKITALTADVNSAYYTDPGTIAQPWTGAIDTAGAGAYKMTINVNTSSFVPEGTLLASLVSPIYNLGANGVGSYSPEQVLFRCSPDSAGTMFEYFTTNADNASAGGTDVSAVSGIPGTYQSRYAGVVFRVTNATTGQTVTRYWQARPLTDLDVDSQGWFLVKAKNFSAYKVELFKCSTCPSGGYQSTGAWLETQPFAYSAFRGGASGTIPSSGLSVGADSAVQYSGWYGSWPGAINPYGNITVRRSATCAVTNTTPMILFPTMTVGELTQGGSRQLPITVQIECQPIAPSGMSSLASGTAANQTALGLLAPPENVQQAINAGLKTSGSGVTYLLSNGYGTDPGVATGVGVALSRPGGGALNFLSNQYVTTGGAADGWDPVLNDTTGQPPVNGWTRYTRVINATFKAFAPGSTPVTAGRYNATAQVIVRVQ
ncbi:fimbrial protein [Burkholderia pseudomultivorans]|uniref:Fimbrial protein n=1 Tax=Burkholderia pseudomultivorans TaxID=1207504 RepID=A0A132EGF3_9BURK|nr:fimbrial protein [Burkholderia pseudomultivorans]KWF27194.1 fimbrial protein [Burkholderia pseudomultivorans]